jgi:hypothetical protein
MRDVGLAAETVEAPIRCRAGAVAEAVDGHRDVAAASHENGVIGHPNRKAPGGLGYRCAVQVQRGRGAVPQFRTGRHDVTLDVVGQPVGGTRDERSVDVLHREAHRELDDARAGSLGLRDSGCSEYEDGGGQRHRRHPPASRPDLEHASP